MLTAEQKLQVDNLMISAWIPGWFYAARGIGRALETDEREREALLTGLKALGPATKRAAPRKGRPGQA